MHVLFLSPNPPGRNKDERDHTTKFFMHRRGCTSSLFRVHKIKPSGNSSLASSHGFLGPAGES